MADDNQQGQGSADVKLPAGAPGAADQGTHESTVPLGTQTGVVQPGAVNPSTGLPQQPATGTSQKLADQFPPAKLTDENDTRTDQEKAAAGNPAPTEEQKRTQEAIDAQK